MTLDPKHNQAIREEIGERLSFLLAREPSPLPRRLRELIARFDELDKHHEGSRG
jgi:hypothetical protein